LNINILEVARPDYEPTSPNKAHVIPIALAAGLLFGVLTALGLDHSDRRFRSEEEMVAVLGTPVLGAIPRIPGRQSVFKTGQSVALDPSSQAAEAYRTIRTATYFMPAGNEAKTLLVTSPTQGDGKTTLASNLGIAMAQTGRRTLVIDADFRRPMQHKAFGLSHTPGLTNVLAGEHALDDAIEQTAVDGLDLLPAGATPSNPSEMLNSTEFARLLEELSQSYDRVLVDSPPVLSVTDASILAAMCDVTLLVLKAGSSTRRMAKQARNVLLDVGGAILGVVVNAVSHKQEQYGYYGYGYRCDYRYGQDHKSKPDRRSQQADVPAAPTTALTCSPKTDPC
jgi:capsular exopolysaccharide synthesis family protein